MTSFLRSSDGVAGMDFGQRTRQKTKGIGELVHSRLYTIPVKRQSSLRAPEERHHISEETDCVEEEERGDKEGESKRMPA